MDATDLMLGNYLHDNLDRLCEIEELHVEKSGEDSIVAPAIIGPITTLPHKPILLNERWMKVFGFHHIALTPHNPDLCLSLGKDEKTRFLTWNKYHNDYFYAVKIGDETKSINLFFDIKYVHQLQNLYHSLTGQKLKLKS